MRRMFKAALCSLGLLASAAHAQAAPSTQTVDPIRYKVGIIGAPSFPESPNPDLEVPWTDANVKKMRDLGFNTIQINMAWAYRPYDEALNLEDVVPLPKEYELPTDRALENTLHSPDKIAARAAELKRRIALCKKYGLHIIFQFGAPFVGFPPQMDPPVQITTDPKTVARYRALIQEFGREFPGVDDLMIYTYDQDAWMCSEFGPQASCHGIPLSEREATFLNVLAGEWKTINPAGRLWWEPWELSAGEVYDTIPRLNANAIGLAIHSSIAEVMITNPADDWFKNVLYEGKQYGVPVIGEVFMGTPTEEMEPYTDVPSPLSTLRELQAVYRAGDLTGIKEYFGNVPTKEDPNLRMTSIFFRNPDISEQAALEEDAQPYGPAAEGIIRYWKLVSAAIDVAPWKVSWRFRRVGYSDPKHAMTAATLKGASWQSPGWQSTRRSTFMRTDETTEPNFWEREDIQLRCGYSADLLRQAIAAGNTVRSQVPEALRATFDKGMGELDGFRVRMLAYSYHLKETNLADDIRTAKAQNMPVRQDNVDELRKTLLEDQKNQGSAEPIGAAVKLLDTDLDKFLATYFLPSEPTGDQPAGSTYTHGSSITSN